MQPRTIPDAARREIIGRVWDGETFAHIARDLGVSSYQVSTLGLRALPLGSSGGHRSPRL